MFKKAQRQKAKLRLALAGPSGSGKTLSALRLAKGLVGDEGKIAVVDTENNSASLYADHPRFPVHFDVMDLKAPYSPERYVEAMREAAAAGYDVVIVDSGSHAWMGEGGMLDIVDLIARANRGNSMSGWKGAAPIEKKFIDAILQTDIHVIMTLRTKTEWEITKDEQTGKTKPVKVGLKPEQRQGLEYEFTLVFDLCVDGNLATASKDRTSLYMGRPPVVLDEEIGRQLRAWLDSGEDAPAPAPQPSPRRSDEPKADPSALAWSRVLTMTGGDSGKLFSAVGSLAGTIKRDLGPVFPENNPLLEMTAEERSACLRVIDGWWAKKGGAA